jgi:hypothetical protein
MVTLVGSALEFFDALLRGRQNRSQLRQCLGWRPGGDCGSEIS